MYSEERDHLENLEGERESNCKTDLKYRLGTV